MWGIDANNDLFKSSNSSKKEKSIFDGIGSNSSNKFGASNSSGGIKIDQANKGSLGIGQKDSSNVQPDFSNFGGINQKTSSKSNTEKDATFDFNFTSSISNNNQNKKAHTNSNNMFDSLINDLPSNTNVNTNSANNFNDYNKSANSTNKPYNNNTNSNNTYNLSNNTGYNNINGNKAAGGNKATAWDFNFGEENNGNQNDDCNLDFLKDNKRKPDKNEINFDAFNLTPNNNNNNMFSNMNKGNKKNENKNAFEDLLNFK